MAPFSGARTTGYGGTDYSPVEAAGDDDSVEYNPRIGAALGRTSASVRGGVAHATRTGSVSSASGAPSSVQEALVVERGAAAETVVEDGAMEYMEKIQRGLGRWERVPEPVEVAAPQQAPLSKAFFLLGIGALLPWSAFLSTRDFYVTAFVGVPFDILLSLSYMLSMCSTSVYFTLFPRSQSLYAWDIVAGFSFFALVTFFMPMLAPSAPVTGWADDHLWAVLGAVVALGFVGAVTQSSLFAVAALFEDGACMKAVNAGGGLAAVIFALIRMGTLVTKRSPGEDVDDQMLFADDRKSTYLFFSSCAVFCLFCVMQAVRVSGTREWKETMHDAAHSSSVRRGRSSLEQQIMEVRSVVSDVWEPFAAVWLTFAVTLGLFPAVFFNMRSPVGVDGEAAGRLPPSWFSILVVGLFGVGDWLGKAAVFETFGLTSRSSVLFASFLRLGFCPLVILIARGLWSVPDWGILIVALLFGGSNGLVTGASFVLGPSLVEFQDKDKAGKSIFLALMLGMASGALLGPFFMLFVPQSA